MYQRLLLVLLVLFISGAAIAQDVMSASDGDYIYDSTAAEGSLTNPIPAPPGVIQKWVHDPLQKAAPGTPPTPYRITWSQSDFKSYRYNGLSFRLRFPKNYDPAKKYPLIVFLHGAGEAADINNSRNTNTADRENQDQLYWGARTFRDRIDADLWNGFLLFPQLLGGIDNAGTQWDFNTIAPVNDILDSLELYNGLDPDRVIATGLSAGALGVLKYAALFPKRIATVVSAGPESMSDVVPYIDDMVHIPIWVSAGGTDDNPLPSLVVTTRDQITARGANFYLSYFPTKAHDTWEQEWGLTDVYNNLILTSYWNSASKAQPLVYFQNDKFCTGQPISAKMGITAGFYAYEWQFNNGSGFATIAGATANTYTATQAGQYRVHFKRTASYAWSAWTPNPVVISTRTCSGDTAFAEHFEQSPVNYYVTFSAGPGGGNSPYFQNNTGCQNGLFVNSTEVFTQDASGRQGGKFMLNNTSNSYTYVDGNGNTQTVNCDYYAGDQIWRSFSPATVIPNTDYAFSFYMGNQGTNVNISPNSPLTKITAKINNAAISPTDVQAVWVGNVSWKKYVFVWNSGPATSAELAITNSTIDGAGNDFVLDEISLVKYTPPVMPADAFKNVTLWSKAGVLTGPDNSLVGLWTNSNFNGNNLQQAVPFSQPLLKNNSIDNINFNPIVSLNTTAITNLKVTGGFSGTADHQAVHAFMVARFNNIGQNVNVLGEGTSTPAITGDSIRLAYPGIVSWKAGNAGNTLVTPNNTNVANKTALWTFSKDNIFGTGSGNKQDIRKDGIVVVSTNAVSVFTGNNSNFSVGTFDGKLAELIYVLDSQMTSLKQNRIESYLAIKYGTTLGTSANPVNYTASDSTTIFWPASTIYQNDVFGIGTDSLSGLVQTKSNSVNSGSGDGTGQFAKGNLVLATGTVLQNNRFLMIGNDAAALTEIAINNGDALPVAVGAMRLRRSWKVINTGAVGQVDLSFDTTGIASLSGGSTLTNYMLMIDNDGDGNFNNGTLSFFTATGVTNKQLNFSGVTLNNGVVFTIITNRLSSALPAVWLGFTVTAVNGNALLNWKTGDEINVDHYVVEHSINGVNFTAIGSVTAANNSGINNYSFTQDGLTAGTHYYRIRRVDKDGDSGYSDIKSIKITATSANVQVRPNPVTGATLELAITAQQNNQTMVRVMSADGKLLVQQAANLAAGSNFVHLTIGSVPPGIYLVQVQLSGEIITKKFIRQR